MMDMRVLRWRLYLVDFSPSFKCIEGKENVLADCFSRLPCMEKTLEEKKSSIDIDLENQQRGKVVPFEELQPLQDSEDTFHVDMATINTHMPCKFSCFRDWELPFVDPLDKDITESFYNLPVLEEMRNPITIFNIQQHQFEDEALNMRKQANPHQFTVQIIQGKPVICVGHQSTWKIALPTKLMNDTIAWYQKVLGHCGRERLYNTITSRFYAPGIKTAIDLYDCEECQRYKLHGAGYRHLPPREARMVSWDEVAVDLIGPWKIELPNGKSTKIMALRVIDTVTNLVELIRIRNKTVKHFQQQFREVVVSLSMSKSLCT